MLALKKGQLKTIQETKQKNESVQKQNTQKIQKEIQIRRHPTHDGQSRYDKKNYNQGLLHHLSDQEKTENRKKRIKLSGIFMFILQLFFKPPQKNLQTECPPIRRRLASILFCSMTAEFSNFSFPKKVSIRKKRKKEPK